MPLTKEQIKALKSQLSEQIQHLPPDKKKEAQKQIDEMSDEAIETMLQQQSSQNQKIFRSIISGEIPSKIIDQNKDAIAVLSIKSISKGHIIIIPKEAITDPKELPSSISSLAKKIAKKISSKLHSTDTQIQTEFLFGEIVLHVIPIYDKPLSLDSPRQDTSEEELEDLYKKLRVVKKPKVIKLTKKPKKSAKIIKKARRIP